MTVMVKKNSAPFCSFVHPQIVIREFHRATLENIYSELPSSYLDSFSFLVLTYRPKTNQQGLLNKSRHAVNDCHWFNQSMRFSTVSKWQQPAIRPASCFISCLTTKLQVSFIYFFVFVCGRQIQKEKKKNWIQAAFWDRGSLGVHWLPVKQNHRQRWKWAVDHMASEPGRETTTPPVATWSYQCRKWRKTQRVCESVR